MNKRYVILFVTLAILSISFMVFCLGYYAGHHDHDDLILEARLSRNNRIAELQKLMFLSIDDFMRMIDGHHMPSDSSTALMYIDSLINELGIK